MLNILICDDNARDGESILEALNCCGFSGAYNALVRDNVSEVLLDIEYKSSHIDILLLDIRLSEDGSENGIDIAEKIHELDSRCQIIFVSAYKGYFEQVYLTEHIAFVSKPVKPFYLKSAIERAVQNLNRCDASVMVVSDRKNTVIQLSRIVYLERMGRVTYIILESGEAPETYEKLGEIVAKSDGTLIQCHESYAVNLFHIIKHSNTEFITDTGKHIPISYRHRSEIKKQFISYVTGVKNDAD